MALSMLVLGPVRTFGKPQMNEAEQSMLARSQGIPFSKLPKYVQEFITENRG